MIRVEQFTQEEEVRPAQTLEESDDERRAMIELATELGLERQAALHKTKVEPVVAEQFQWRPAKDVELVVYGFLCPQKTDLNDYTDEALPKRVLELVKQAKPHFDSFVVWHKAERVKDSVLFGKRSVLVNPGEKYEWKRVTLYPIARWGGELEAFDKLTKRALEVFRTNAKSALNALERKVKTILGDVIDLEVDGFVAKCNECQDLAERLKYDALPQIIG